MNETGRDNGQSPAQLPDVVMREALWAYLRSGVWKPALRDDLTEAVPIQGIETIEPQRQTAAETVQSGGV
nr:hypothetical protein [Mycobacterium rhizamassiliense]